MFQRLKMTPKLILLFSLPLALCLILAAVLVVQQVGNRVVLLGEDSVSDTAESNADLVSGWIESRMAVVRTLARTEEPMSGDTERAFAFVRHFGQQMSAEFEMLFFVDRNGDAHHHNGNVASRSDRAYFQELVVDRTRESLVTDPLYSGTTGNPIIVLAHVVEDAAGEVVGMLGATVTLETVTQLVDDVSTEQATAWLVDSQGVYVAHPEEDRRMQENALESDNADYAAMARRMVAGETGVTDLPLQGERRYLVAHNPVADTPGWSLAVGMPHDQVMAPAHELRQSLLLLFGLVLLVLVGVVVLVSRRIVGQLKATGSAMDQIAAGDGDLTQRLDESRHDELGDLARSFNRFVEGLHVLVKQVAEAAMQLGAASEQLAVSSREANEQVRQQQQETDQVASAMTEMAASVSEVAENAAEAETAAGKSSQSVEAGDAVVQRTATEVNALAGEVQKAVDVMERLQQDAESIGTVLEVIHGVADQTNLLALNAAIEAARAGESGRGFAVVAEEVRALANRTQTSTEEIRETIEKLQGASREAVGVMSSGHDKTREVVDWALQASESLQEITNGIRTINEMNAQIASSTEEQSAVAEDVNKALVRISTGVEQLSSGSNQIANASDELARLASGLQEQVGRFKV